jgi:hypothetical protein
MAGRRYGSLNAKPIEEAETIDAEIILDHSYKKFGDKELTFLGGVLQQNTMLLTEIRLDNNVFGQEGMTALGVGLQHNTTVTKLDLSHNAIGAFGATVLGMVLRCNATLTELNLDYNGIGNVGATALGKGLLCNTALIKVNLASNSIGDEGAKVLGLALEKNTTLADLYLFHNNIGDEGATAFAVALKHNTTLIELNLFLTNIGDVGKKAFEVALQHNTTMRLLVLQEDIIPSIANCIARNNELFMNQFWLPCLHNGFLKRSMIPSTHYCHEMIIISLLCSSYQCPALPNIIWHNIFGFWKRKDLSPIYWEAFNGRNTKYAP